ncbi:MAG: MBL fold metallo-hydrolase, partial [Pyrinomonadaceae bacterium]|nr:MBL fold metallo-hydrolase [Pyrinomonadaceae bacterium]
IVPDTEFRLDGGAMFGVVPRNLWSKVCPPDDQNRIRMNMNCVFIEAGPERILIETGIGEKFSDKQTRMYGITRARPFADSLRAVAGVDPEAITIVINTHLHFDHAGGNTALNVDGKLAPAFPNARYLVSRGELEHGERPTERDRASYLSENWQPLKETGQLELKDADYEVVPGLRMETHAGHNRTMQCWSLEQGGRTLFGFADLVPMRAHVSYAWIMGYDLFPTETLEAKKRLLPQAAREKWVCLFYHEPDSPLGRLIEEDGRLRAEAYLEGVSGCPS